MERFLILLPILFVFACGLTSAGRRGNLNAVSGISNQLAASLHKKLSAQDGNVFCSPLSVSTAIAMLFYGAGGRTAEEMRRMLGYKEAGLTDEQVHTSFKSLLETYSEGSSKEYLLYVANAILTQKDYSIRPEYKNGLQEFYKAIARDVDFATEGRKAVREINDWVKLKTNNQITKLVDEVDPSTIMVLLNAVYFKGTWKTEFDPRLTSDSTFFNKGLRSQQKKVPMMQLVENLPYGRRGDLQVLELPYKGEDISMVIVLPDNIDGLATLEQELQPDTLKELRGLTGKTKVHVSLPKFKLEYKKKLNDDLFQLGLKSIFGRNANFSGISEAGRMAVSEVIHKAVIEVNEEGSEASAVTGILIPKLRPAFPDPRFIADHPFHFAIVDRSSDLILFQGSVKEL